MNDKQANGVGGAWEHWINALLPKEPPAQFVPVAPDVRQGIKGIEAQQKQQELDHSERRFRQEEKSKEQRLKQRKEYANKLFWLGVVWLVIVLGIVVAKAAGEICLSDTILITLITSSTVNVLALPLYAIKYIFQLEAESDKETKSDKK